MPLKTPEISQENSRDGVFSKTIYNFYRWTIAHYTIARLHLENENSSFKINPIPLLVYILWTLLIYRVVKIFEKS